MKYRGLILILLLTGALSGCGQKPDAPAKEEAKGPDVVTVEMATAQTRPMEVTVQAQGTLAPAQGAVAHVASPVAGRIVSVAVREGDRVTAGQILAAVDNRPQQAQARSATFALSTAEAQARQSEISARATATDQINGVRLARLTLEAARQDAASGVQQARTALLAAQTDLQRTRAGARPQEIAQAEAAIGQAQATRDRARAEQQRVQFLFEKGIDARRQLDDANTALAVAEAALASAQQQGNLLRAGARAEDLRAAELRVQQAQDALRQAQQSGDAKVAQAQAGLRQAQQSALQVDAKRQEAAASRQGVAQKQADLAAAQATAAVAILRAPFSGIITRRTLNPGDLADPATPVLEISDTHSLNLLANLAAEDGLKVRQGMAAHIAVADLPGQTFAGHVLSVGQVDPQTNLLAVRIAVANPQAKLKSGTFATAAIVLRRDPEAVVVPKQALVTTEDKPTLFVVGADNVAHKQNVTVGAETDTGVEILSGVKAGAQVIQLGQYELSDGAKVQTAEKADKADKGDSKAETSEKKGDAADSKAEPAAEKSEAKPAKADEKAKDTAP